MHSTTHNVTIFVSKTIFGTALDVVCIFSNKNMSSVIQRTHIMS